MVGDIRTDNQKLIDSHKCKQKNSETKIYTDDHECIDFENDDKKTGVNDGAFHYPTVSNNVECRDKDRGTFLFYNSFCLR